MVPATLCDFGGNCDYVSMLTLTFSSKHHCTCNIAWGSWKHGSRLLVLFNNFLVQGRWKVHTIKEIIHFAQYWTAAQWAALVKVMLFLNPVILCTWDAGFGSFAFYLRLLACGTGLWLNIHRLNISAFVTNNARFPVLTAASHNRWMIKHVTISKWCTIYAFLRLKSGVCRKSFQFL